MKTLSFETREQWMQARMGKVTGSRAADIMPKTRGTGKRIGFYEVVAERLAVSEADFEGYVPNETPMARGTRLQKFAVERFKKETGKDVDEKLVLWMREDNEGIAVSPDGVIGEDAAIETKCLASARHIEAYLNQAIPDDYEHQTLQYFVTNEKLQTLYVVFYDPRIPAKDFFYMTLHRADVQAKAEVSLKLQLQELKEVDEVVAKLTNF